MARNKSKASVDAAAAADIGRYKKKVEDQTKELKGMKERLQALNAVVKGLNTAMEADLAALAVKYGEFDAEANGYRLEIPEEDIRNALEKYEVRARKDEERKLYIIGVLPRGEDAKNGD